MTIEIIYGICSFLIRVYHILGDSVKGSLSEGYDVNKKPDAESSTGNQIWTKLKGFSSGTLKRNKKRNQNEPNTSP